MPEKSVRDMNRLEKGHYSLEGKVFRATLTGSIVLGLLALVIGLGLYSFSLVERYTNEAYQVACGAERILERETDALLLVGEMMQVYRENGNGGGEQQYQTITQKVTCRKTEAILKDFYYTDEIDAIYLVAFDRGEGKMICLAAPRPSEEAYTVEEWENFPEEKLQSLLEPDEEGKRSYIGRTDERGWICTGGAVVNGNNTYDVFVLVDISMNRVIVRIGSFLLQYLTAMSFLVFVYIYLTIRHIRKTLVKPIDAIVQAAREYAKDKQSGSIDCEHFRALNIHTGDEVENLSLVLVDMEKDMTEYMEHLTKVTAEKERIGTELSLARRIQTSMLPSAYPAFPEREEMDIVGMMFTAQEVGGDFYDYFLVDEDHLYMVMADVSGKGIPAALFMMAIKIIFANQALLGISAAEILKRSNEILCRSNREKMFVTAWVGILEISTGKLTAANAGHEYPILLMPEEGYSILKDKHGFVVGGFAESRYQDYELQLVPGAKLFLMTDGITEATDADNKQFGRERVLAALNKDTDAGVKETVENVKAEVDAFVGGAEQFDDLTMLCLEYRGKTGGAESSV